MNQFGKYRKNGGGLKNINSAWVVYSLLIFSFISIWLNLNYLERYSIGRPVDSVLLQVNICISAVVSSLLILSPFFVIPSKWRGLVLIPVWIVPIYCMANVWYFRFFVDLIPFDNLFAFNNFDSTLFDSCFLVVGNEILLLFIGPILVSIYYLIYRKKLAVKDFSSPKKWLFVMLCILPYIGQELRFSSFIRGGDSDSLLSFENRFLHPYSCEVRDQFQAGGLASFFVRNTVASVYRGLRDRTLTPQQINVINDFWTNHNAMISGADSLRAVFKSNYDKQLILIVVESLNSEAVTAEIGGEQLMPVLNSLCNQAGTISCLQVKSQISHGSSSDGQYIVNSGHLPLKNQALVNEFVDNKFITLSDNLNGKSIEIICESPTMWNHTKTTKSWGFDDLISNTDSRADKEGINKDEAVLKTGVEEILKRKDLGYYFITTIGMHAPYESGAKWRRPWIDNATGLSDQRKAYYNCCNIFDEALGKFIEGLKKAGKYDNSVIVLASDHAGLLDGKRQEQPIAFVALNTGVHMKIDRPVQQIDIYPTILEIMGRYPSKTNNGMGYSVLNPNPATWFDPNNKARQDSLQQIANDMLFGDWYRKYAGKISN